MPTPRLPGSAPAMLSEHLDDEWAALCRRPQVLRRARSWALTATPVEHLDELLAATGYRRADADEGHNEVMRRLVDVARGDDLAGRVVIQRILPGLLAMIRRRRHAGGTEGLFEEIIGAAWISVRTAYIAPGSRAVAATLVRDAYHRAFVAPSRRLSTTEVSIDPAHFLSKPATFTVGPLEELVELLSAARRRGLADADLELVRQLLHAGSPGQLAKDRKVTARTVRNHRDQVVYRIRRLAVAADAA